MYLADYHVHSAVSFDASVPMTDMAAAAFAAGMQEVAFTDHLGMGDWDCAAPPPDHDWGPAREALARARADWNGRLTLRLGVELGEISRAPALAERFLASAPDLDFVIASVHGLPAYQWTDFMFLREADEAECRREIQLYLDQVRQTALWGRFSVLGHLTLPLRYMNERRGFHATFDGFEEEMEEIFRILIRQGLGIEVNTNRGHQPLPGEKWLRMYRALGGEIVTLGSDAHGAAQVGCAIREGQALLRRCGFSRFCTFQRLEPVWHTL